MAFNLEICAARVERCPVNEPIGYPLFRWPDPRQSGTRQHDTLRVAYRRFVVHAKKSQSHRQAHASQTHASMTRFV